MIERAAELNRVLLVVSEIMDEKMTADYRTTIQQCKDVVVEARMPDHEATINYCVRIGFLQKKRSKLLLTVSGKEFVDLNPSRMYDLSEEQNRFLIRGFFLDGVLRHETRKCLECFTPVFAQNTFTWSPDDGPLQGERWIADHLCQVGLLIRDKDHLEVTPDYVDTIATFLDDRNEWTEEQAEEYYREKKEVGILGEELIRLFEIRRLRSLGCKAEASCVRRISRLKVNAGYDIESFDSKTANMKFNRFIEVKASRGKEVRFVWTENEMKVATQLGKQYWIYYQPQIKLNDGRAESKPILFQNPIETILKGGRMKVTPQGVLVKGDWKGTAHEE